MFCCRSLLSPRSVAHWRAGALAALFGALALGACDVNLLLAEEDPVGTPDAQAGTGGQPVDSGSVASGASGGSSGRGGSNALVPAGLAGSAGAGGGSGAGGQLVCAAGTSDCNEDAADGCESDFDDRGSCGSCGVVCDPTAYCAPSGCKQVKLSPRLAFGATSSDFVFNVAGDIYIVGTFYQPYDFGDGERTPPGPGGFVIAKYLASGELDWVKNPQRLRLQRSERCHPRRGRERLRHGLLGRIRRLRSRASGAGPVHWQCGVRREHHRWWRVPLGTFQH
jgi:hypothetical protein